MQDMRAVRTEQACRARQAKSAFVFACSGAWQPFEGSHPSDEQSGQRALGALQQERKPGAASPVCRGRVTHRMAQLPVLVARRCWSLPPCFRLRRRASDHCNAPCLEAQVSESDEQGQPQEARRHNALFCTSPNLVSCTAA